MLRAGGGLSEVTLELVSRWEGGTSNRKQFGDSRVSALWGGSGVSEDGGQ